MAVVMPPTKPPAQQARKEIYNIVFATLNRLEIEASPANYELMYDVISGNNPELREKFSRLRKPIADHEVEALARTYLPHHFGKSIHDESASRLQNELTSLKESLQSGQSSLSTFTNMLGQATGKISSIDPRDTKTMQSHLGSIRQLSEVQQSKSAKLLENVSTQISTVAAISDEVEQFERTKFTHPTTRLANRRGFHKKLAELYGAERYPDDISLLFCNLLVLTPFETAEFLRLKEAFLERLGAIVSQTVQTMDFAAWLDRPQIGLIVRTSAETEVQKIADQLKRSCLVAFDSRQGVMPKVIARFGCSTTHQAGTASELVANTEKALQTAIDEQNEKVVFLSGAARKDWMLYRS
nr:diguanylate cyclase [Rhizobium sp. BK399]